MEVNRGRERSENTHQQSNSRNEKVYRQWKATTQKTLTPKYHWFTRTVGMGLCHSRLEIKHREDKGQNNYISLVYTAYSNTHWNCNETDSQGHLHIVHITVLTSVIRCLNKQLPKMEWKKNLYLTVIWSVWHYTDFWQRRQNRFLFFCFYLMCSFFSCSYLVQAY